MISVTPAMLLVSTVSHALALVAFGGFALVLAFGGNWRGTPLYLLVACGTTALWGGVVAFASFYGGLRTPPELVLSTLRSATWIAVLYRLFAESAARHRTGAPDLLRRAVIAVFALLLLADGAYAVTRHPAADDLIIVGDLMVAIIALTLIENLVRNDSVQTSWWSRFLFVGLGGIFAYDLFVYSEALLFRRVNPEFYVVRGAVDAMAVPLMAISFARNPTFDVKIHVSRQFVLHTMTLAGTGVYLLLMALAGYYLRNFGGDWSTLLQMVFFTGALALVFLTLTSGTFRSALRNFISANFFSYKYDYRLEWLQFIRLISAQESLLPLHDRVVQAIANIVDSPSGALWVLRNDAYVNTAAWNAPLSAVSRPADASLEALESSGHIIDLQDGEITQGAGLQPAVPDWLRALPRAWLIMTLLHRHRAVGFLVLALPRVARRLDSEDRELLTTVGNQAASYIAEEESARALLDARQLEMFNQRFAFVVHDIKNLVSQLSLILSNAERHGSNPEFQQDVIATVRHSVQRMKGLLEQISVARRGVAAASPVGFDLAAQMRNAFGDPNGVDPRLRLDLPEAACTAIGEPEAVTQVVRHVMQNALDAIAETGSVALRLDCDGEGARLQIIDDGPGMTAEFIRDTLFRPFGTTKKSGYGIGAYQARELIRAMGGRLEVVSTVGVGTEVSIHLPLAARSSASAAARAGDIAPAATPETANAASRQVQEA